MKKAYIKYIVFIMIVMIFLAASIIFRFKTAKENKLKADISEEMKNKTVVTVWMREANDSETRRYQVKKYNYENKDGIYIDFYTYGQDYNNLLKISLASEKKPDILQYGYYELLRDKQIVSLDDAGIDTSQIGSDNLLYFNKVPYGVKLTGNNVRFIWNKDIFKGAGLNPDNPPKTWDECLSFARQIKKVYPDVVPLEFPAYTMTDIRASIGENSVNLGSIYTSFWDYKKGVYDFSYSKGILSVYNKMYSESLIDKQFNKKQRNDIRMDFYSGKTAMVISTFEDKNYFSNIVLQKFEIGVGDLPKINIDDTKKYYYLDNYNCIVINKDAQNMEAVKKVYQWLLSDDVNSELFDRSRSLPLISNIKSSSDDVLSGYNKVDNFKNETYDPTLYVISSSQETINLFCSAIKGTKSIDEVIHELNVMYNARKQFMAEQDNFDYKYYIER